MMVLRNCVFFFFFFILASGCRKELPLEALKKPSNLYAGGNFSSAGNINAGNIAKWDGKNWSPVGSGTNGAVRCFAVYQNKLIVGGSFTNSGGINVSNIAQWDGVVWSALGNGLNGSVLSLSVYNNELYAGGSFTFSGNLYVARVAQWNGTAWSATAKGINPADTVSSIYLVNTLSVYNSELIAGGVFNIAGNTTAHYIARWNGVFWDSAGGGTNNAVRATYVYKNELYAGGDFVRAGNKITYHIARWNGFIWKEADNGLNDCTSAFMVYNNELYAGGYFTQADGFNSPFIARWNGTDWNTAGNNTIYIHPSDIPTITSLGYYKNELFAGTILDSLGGKKVNHIATWNGFFWSPVGFGIDGGFRPSVYALQEYNK